MLSSIIHLFACNVGNLSFKAPKFRGKPHYSGNDVHVGINGYEFESSQTDQHNQRGTEHWIIFLRFAV